MVMMAFRHALRVGELISLRWDQIDFELGQIFVQRVKNGINSTHPLRGAELRALAQLKREQKDGAIGGGYVFLTRHNLPMTPSNVRKMLESATEKAGLNIKIHPHMLRHFWILD
ncbi:hypothetical protein CCP3SC5AM1_2540001 [Gammaproteobacteria bacterium]